MVEAVIKFARCLVLLAFMAFPTAAFAHRLDEYLQATLVAIEPGDIQLQMNLTPGVAVAEQVLALIDRDHDGVISTNESRAYAEMLKRDLALRVDGHDAPLKLESFTFPKPAELRTGSGIILVDFSVRPGPFTPGTHRLTLENRHLPAISVYLFNAMRPRSGLIQITGQKRNETQSTGEIAFDFHGPPGADRRAGTASVVGLFVVALSGVAYARNTPRNKQDYCGRRNRK